MNRLDDRFSQFIEEPDPIKGFSPSSGYFFLSNFYIAPVWFEGDLFPSSECAYQAAKLKPGFFRMNFQKYTPGESKKKIKIFLAQGDNLYTPEEWDRKKYDIMSQIVFSKFYHNTDIRQALLQTGDAYLEETNYWGDVYWGVCRGKGENKLGEILMKIREYWAT